MSADRTTATAELLSHLPQTAQWQEELYKDLHAHPELSMQETRTRKVIADKLRDLGHEPVELGGGVVATVPNGEGPTVLLRADFDGLPVKEDTGLDYASHDTAIDADGNEVPVMHACGHDTHVTALLGAVELLGNNKQSWSGTLVALFQPGEETGEGAQAMVDAGLADVVPAPDVALGQHVFCAQLPAGHVAMAAGPVLSTAESITVTLFGTGSHGSMPHLSVDPVVLASAIVMRLQTVVSRELAPSEFGVLTVGALQAGNKANIIPDRAVLKINIRAYDEGVRDRIAGAVERIVKAECAASRSPREPEFSYSDRFPLTVNDADVTRTVRSALEAQFGAERVHIMPPHTASEDFSVIPTALGAPYCFWGFGGQTPGVEIPNHNPKFAPVIQPTLSTGTAALVAGALAFLGAGRA